jgi:malate dehydrogenase (oxaloacetate-decarboxylating)(NADP+)
MTTSKSSKAAQARFTDREALQFHAHGKPGKLEITPTKPLTTQRDLSLAYSPGVAVPVRAIAQNPATAYDYGFGAKDSDIVNMSAIAAYDAGR